MILAKRNRSSVRLPAKKMNGMATRFDILKEAYTNLALTPLREQRALKQFRVEYGQSVLLELEQIIEDDVDTQDGKTVFSGIEAVVSRRF